MAGGAAPPGLERSLRDAGLEPTVHVVPLDPKGPDIELAKAAAGGAADVLVCTFDADRHPGQQQLLQALGPIVPGCYVAHLRNPFDTQYAPTSSVQIQPWGFRDVQCAALAKVLTGTLEPRLIVGEVP